MTLQKNLSFAAVLKFPAQAVIGGAKQSGFGRDRSLHALELKGISTTYRP